MPRFGDQDPGAWGWPRCEGQTFVPFSFDGHSFPAGVVRGHGPYWARALEILCGEPGFRLPDSKGLDAGCWGQSCRPIAGSNRWSFHAYGLALDIAAPWNAFGRVPAPSVHRLPSNTGDLLRGMGIEWGGNWSGNPDWMHIESHLTPDEMQSWLGNTEPPPPAVAGFPLPAGCYFGPYEGPNESISGSGRNDAQWRPYLARCQRRLGVTDDGYYGPNTAAATRGWQREHGLSVDGLIGPNTWASLAP